MRPRKPSTRRLPTCTRPCQQRLAKMSVEALQQALGWTSQPRLQTPTLRPSVASPMRCCPTPSSALDPKAAARGARAVTGASSVAELRCCIARGAWSAVAPIRLCMSLWLCQHYGCTAHNLSSRMGPTGDESDPGVGPGQQTVLSASGFWGELCCFERAQVPQQVCITKACSSAWVCLGTVSEVLAPCTLVHLTGPGHGGKEGLGRH